MGKFKLGPEVKAVVVEYFRVFATTFLTLLFSSLAESQDFRLVNWYSILIAAFLSAGPVILVALNPNDPAYGKNSKYRVKDTLDEC